LDVEKGVGQRLEKRVAKRFEVQDLRALEDPPGEMVVSPLMDTAL